MLRVTFSPAPECVVADCWNRAFPTPPCHQTPVVCYWFDTASFFHSCYVYVDVKFNFNACYVYFDVKF